MENSKYLIIIMLILGCIQETVDREIKTTTAPPVLNVTNDCSPDADPNTRKDCLYNIAQMNHDPLYCNWMVESWLRDRCIEDNAKENSDPELCQKILNVNKCIFDVAMENDRLDICFRINPGIWRDACIKNLVNTPLEYDLCIKNTSNSSIESCHLAGAIAKNDISLCEKIKNDEVKSECLMDFAIKDSDLDICGDIGPNYYQECIKKVAINANSSEICKLIEGNLAVTDCLIQVASRTKDAKICEKIDFDVKSRCTGFEPCINLKQICFDSVKE